MATAEQEGEESFHGVTVIFLDGPGQDVKVTTAMVTQNTAIEENETEPQDILQLIPDEDAKEVLKNPDAGVFTLVCVTKDGRAIICGTQAPADFIEAVAPLIVRAAMASFANDFDRAMAVHVVKPFAELARKAGVEPGQVLTVGDQPLPSAALLNAAGFYESIVRGHEEDPDSDLDEPLPERSDCADGESCEACQ